MGFRRPPPALVLWWRMVISPKLDLNIIEFRFKSVISVIIFLLVVSVSSSFDFTLRKFTTCGWVRFNPTTTPSPLVNMFLNSSLCIQLLNLPDYLADTWESELEG